MMKWRSMPRRAKCWHPIQYSAERSGKPVDEPFRARLAAASIAHRPCSSSSWSMNRLHCGRASTSDWLRRNIQALTTVRVPCVVIDQYNTVNTTFRTGDGARFGDGDAYRPEICHAPPIRMVSNACAGRTPHAASEVPHLVGLVPGARARSLPVARTPCRGFRIGSFNASAVPPAVYDGRRPADDSVDLVASSCWDRCQLWKSDEPACRRPDRCRAIRRPRS